MMLTSEWERAASFHIVLMTSRQPEAPSPAADPPSWRSRAIIIELVATLAALGLTMAAFSRFVLFAETRQGVVLPDPVLAAIPGRDLTVPIFAIIYGGILLAIFTLVRHPRRLLMTLRAYTLLVLVRIAVMYTIPLEPPAGMVLLIDPVYHLGPGDILTKDLFFSGHTATMFLLCLTARRGIIRNIFLLATAAMGFMLLVQHCHYTVDVIAAPFFAYTCYRIVVLSSREELRA